MLKVFRAKRFKSLENLEIELPRLTVLFGPNAVGKSNVLDALLVMREISRSQTLSDAMAGGVRGYPAEQFQLPEGGLEQLLRTSTSSFELGADIAAVSPQSPTRERRFRYSVTVQIEPEKGGLLTVQDEYLAELSSAWHPKGQPRVERQDGSLVVRRRNQGGQPRHEPVGLSHTLLSNRQFSGQLYVEYDLVRDELARWYFYFLDPRQAMRLPAPPMEIYDIGVFGQTIASYLFVLQQQYPEAFGQFQRTVRSVIPSIKKIAVDLDARVGTLDVQVEQGGITHSSRVLSEGTLRVMALAALAVNPYPPSLIAFEEPENGVHPNRVELIARLLASIATSATTQVIATTHSPLLASTVFTLSRSLGSDIGLFACSADSRGITKIQRFAPTGDIFADTEIRDAFASPGEGQIVEAMLRRGWLDG